MNRILLLGAGFSRNWGGPLASDMFDRLLEQPEIDRDTDLRGILWDHKDKGGFENALEQVQQDWRANPGDAIHERRLESFQAAIDRVFAEMDRGYAARFGWEFTNESARMLRTTLVQFDSIFTLNQDLLFERFYFNQNVLLSRPDHWDGVVLPGVREQRHDGFPYDPAQSRWTPLRSDQFTVRKRDQPYFKLHCVFHAK